MEKTACVVLHVYNSNRQLHINTVNYVSICVDMDKNQTLTWSKMLIKTIRTINPSANTMKAEESSTAL